MDEKLKILIQAVLDATSSEQAIRAQLKNLQVGDIKVSLSLDTAKIETNNAALKESIAVRTKCAKATSDLNAAQEQVNQTEIKAEKFIYKKNMALKRGENFFRVNTNAAKKYSTEWKTIQDLLKSSETEEELNSAVRKQRELFATIKAQGDLGSSFLKGITQGAKKFVSWMISSYGVMAVVSSLKTVISNVKELDKAVVDLQMATGSSRSEAQKLLNTYNELGQRIGATTTEVSDSASTWLRQGLSIKDTNTMIENSMILSKVGLIESADATQYLTSVMKGFGVSVENTLGIVDRLAAVDLAAAVDAGGIAEAMSRTATSASTAGVSIEKLIGYLAVVGETTQRDMSSIGESFEFGAAAA